jgi:hypothetical protein
LTEKQSIPVKQAGVEEEPLRSALISQHASAYFSIRQHTDKQAGVEEEALCSELWTPVANGKQGGGCHALRGGGQTRDRGGGEGGDTQLLRGGSTEGESTLARATYADVC